MLKKSEISEISEINIIPIKPKEGLMAIASCVINKEFYVGSIGIYTKLKGGYRLTYPNKKSGSSTINIFHPISKELGDAIENAIIQEYENLVTIDI